MVGFHCRPTERDLAGKLGWRYAPRTGIWKLISHHFFVFLFLCVCWLFSPQKTLTSYHQCSVHYPGSGKGLVRPSCLGQKWGLGVSCVIWGRPDVQLTDTDSLCWSHLSPFPTISFLFFFSFFCNSPIIPGNELHMAMAFTSLCEICSSCIVYQFNMLTTDAISVSQLSYLKSPFPTNYLPPSLPIFFPTGIVAAWLLFQADAMLQLKDQTCQRSQPCCGHFSWWKVLKYSLCFLFPKTQGELITKGAKDGKWDPEPFEWD